MVIFQWLADIKAALCLIRGLRALPPDYRVPLNDVVIRIQGLGQLKNWIALYCSRQADEHIQFCIEEEKRGSLAYFYASQSWVVKRLLQEALGYKRVDDPTP